MTGSIAAAVRPSFSRSLCRGFFSRFSIWHTVSAKPEPHTMGNCKAALIGHLPTHATPLRLSPPRFERLRVWTWASPAVYDFQAMETPADAFYIPCSKRWPLLECDT